jgi:hypothetical protein
MYLRLAVHVMSEEQNELLGPILHVFNLGVMDIHSLVVEADDTSDKP